MMTTATRTMTAVSRCVRHSPSPSDLSPERPGSAAGRALRLNSGILSPKTLSTPLSDRCPGDLEPRTAIPSGRAVSILALISSTRAMKFGLRLDLHRARPRNVDIIHGGNASRPRRHHDDAICKKDRFSNRMGDEGDRLPRLHPDFLNEQFISSRVNASSAPKGSSINSTDGSTARLLTIDSALLHAARKLAREFVFEALEIDPFEQMLDPLHVGAAALQLERERDVLEQIAPRQEIGVLKDHRDLRMRLGDDFVAKPNPAATSDHADLPSTTAASSCRSPRALECRGTRLREPRATPLRARAPSRSLVA